MQNEANFRELEAISREYLKSHKSVEKLESEARRYTWNDFLSEDAMLP